MYDVVSIENLHAFRASNLPPHRGNNIPPAPGTPRSTGSQETPREATSQNGRCGKNRRCRNRELACRRELESLRGSATELKNKAGQATPSQFDQSLRFENAVWKTFRGSAISFDGRCLSSTDLDRSSTGLSGSQQLRRKRLGRESRSGSGVPFINPPDH